MKKIITALLLMFFVAGCSSSKPTSNVEYKTDDYGYESLTNMKHIVEKIDYKQAQKKIEANETFYLMLGRPSCGHCVDAIPDFSKFAEKNKISEVYYLSTEYMVEDMEKSEGQTDKQFEDQVKANKPITDFLQKTFNFDGATPIFYYIKDGKVTFSTNDVNSEGMESWGDIIEKFFEETIIKK